MKEYEQIMRFFRHFEYANIIYIKHPMRSADIYYEGYRLVVTTHSSKLRIGFIVTRENGKNEQFLWKERSGEITFEGSSRSLLHHLKHFENYTNKWDCTIEYSDALF